VGAVTGLPRVRSRAIVALAAAAAVVPVAVATVHALTNGWTPSSDDGVIALRAFDVLSERPPLVGQYTQSSTLIDEPAYSLGPLLYWLLAIPAHLGPAAITLTMGAVSAACVAGAVVLAARRGGPGLALATALALILTSRSLPVEVPYEIWNAWSGVFPFTLLLFVAWSVACGDHWLLPLLALTASFVIQAHLTYVTPAVLVVAVALGGLVLQRPSAPGRRRWAIAAAVVLVACWTAPAVDQLTREPGNMGQVVALATDDHETFGVEAGLRTAARTFGAQPWWSLPARSHTERLLETTEDIPLLTGLSAFAIVGAVVAGLLAARRARRPDLTAALALALALCVAVVAVAAALPTGSLGFAAVGYTLVWTSPAGMWVWLALGWTAWALLPGARVADLMRRPQLAWAALGASGLLAVAVAAGRDYETADRGPPGLKDYRLIDATVDRVTAAVAGGDGVHIDVPITVRNSLTFQSAIAYGLRREGLSFTVPPRLVKEMGRGYRGPGFGQVIQIRDPDAPAAGGRVLVRNRAVAVILVKR
jgi:hypothetical protein